MRNFCRKVLASAVTTLFSIIVVVLIIVGVGVLAMRGGVEIEEHSWLVVDIYGDITEYDPPGDIINRIMGGDSETLQRIWSNMEKAAVDEDIDGVLFHLSATNNLGLAKLQELRDAIDHVQAAGKPVYAWGDVLDLRTLYLAAACDSVFMPGGGYFDFRGLATESVHVRGTLDKLGIKPHLHKIKEYKSATEMIMNKEMSPAAREMREWMLDEYWEMIVPTIAEDRGLTEDRLVELMAYAEFEPDEALDAGLLDAVMYWPEMEMMLGAEDYGTLETVSNAAYAGVTPEQAGIEGGERIAVVHAQGNIGGRRNRIDPALGIMMGHESVGDELRRCRLDESVKAVVFRVDSGGGESLASDLIAHEIDLLRQVKPVVVSMVDVAASGGYMISYKATKMMADPLTVTGSIGSINGFFNMKGFYDKIGFSKSYVTRGPMALMGGDYREPTPEEWDRHVDAHWKGFNRWLADVADRRGIAFEDAKNLAYGRVWTGRQAVANGLIDATGNLRDAVALAAELAELPEDETPSVVHLPERQDLLQMLLSDEKPRDKVAMLVRWQAYRLLRSEIATTSRTLTAERTLYEPSRSWWAD